MRLRLFGHGKMVDGRQIQIGGEQFAANVAEAKRFQTCGVFGCIFSPNLPNQAWLLSDVLRQWGEGLRHFCAEWAAAGKINLQYNHGLLSIRITDGNSISVFAAVFLSSARNEHDFFSFEASTA